MILEKIADRIDEANLDAPVFINFMPSESSPAILISDPLTGIETDQELRGFYKSTFDIVVRDTNYQKGEALCKAVVEAISLESKAIGEVKFYYIRGDHLPVSYPASEAGIIEFSVGCSFACSL